MTGGGGDMAQGLLFLLFFLTIGHWLTLPLFF